MSPKQLGHKAKLTLVHFFLLFQTHKTYFPDICFFPSCRITIFGTGAKWLSVLQERNLKPGEFFFFPVIQENQTKHKCTLVHTDNKCERERET